MEIVQKTWGRFYTYDSEKDYKLKKLVISPGKQISNQRHFKRNELWTIIYGSGILDHNGEKQNITPGMVIVIQRENWHYIKNTGEEDLVLIEIQRGEECIESDIERK